MTTYTSPFSGQQIYPTAVSYEALSISSNTVLQWPVNGNTNTPVSSIIDVTATTTGLLLEMPPAYQVSTGQSVLVRNVGSNTFTVTDNSGNTIIAITSGVSQYIFVTDNTTVNGSWSSIPFGAGTSSANAASLAGYGLLASSLTLNQIYPVLTYSASTTLTSANSADLSVWTGGAGALTLPLAASVSSGWFITIKNNGTGILTITPSSSDTIDGNSSQQLQLTESISLVSGGGTSWSSFGLGRSNSFAYTLLSLPVTGGTTTLTSAQAANTIQTYTGTLTSPQIVIVPPTVQLYTVTNNTSGATFTFKTTSGTGVQIPSSSSMVLSCTGTEVYNAASGASNTFTSAISVISGSASTPSVYFGAESNTGFYRPTTGQWAISILGSQAGVFSANGLTVPNGIGGGAF